MGQNSYLSSDDGNFVWAYLGESTSINDHKCYFKGQQWAFRCWMLFEVRNGGAEESSGMRQHGFFVSILNQGGKLVGGDWLP